MRALYFVVSFILTFAITTGSNYSEAATVKSVKGKRVTISVDQDSVQKGDYYNVVGSNGKTKGILRIQKVKGKTAYGVLGRGKATSGDGLKVRPRKTKSSKTASSSKNSEPVSQSSAKSYWGIMAGISQNSASVKLATSPSVTVDLTGSGFSAKGFFDYQLLPWLYFRALGGMEQFVVGGASNNDVGGCGGECTAEITYITLDSWARIPFGSDTFRLWVGAGFDLLFPMSKSSTALDEGSITNTSIIGIGGGFDMFMGPNSFIPVQVEYGLYPSSNQVSANAIMIRAGYGTSF